VIKRERKGVKQEEGELPRRPSMFACRLVASAAVVTLALIRTEQRPASTELLDLLPLITDREQDGHDVTHPCLCLLLTHAGFMSLTHSHLRRAGSRKGVRIRILYKVYKCKRKNRDKGRTRKRDGKRGEDESKKERIK
jgi:hypothetical protein